MAKKTGMRVMVDMSATILHHGHIRLLQRAKEIGTVVVGLTSDEEVFRRKGYLPELPFAQRKELLEGVRYVDEVVETPWLITDAVLAEHDIDVILHGSDNSNQVDQSKLRVVPRTEGVSSWEMRERSVAAIVSVKNKKALFTAGPGSLAVENLLGLEPCFGRGDRQYQAIEDRVLSKLRQMSGHDNIARVQGSASLALEIAVRNFVSGRVLLINTGYYADRLVSFCKTAKARGIISELDVLPYASRATAQGRYDWVITVYTETSTGLFNDIRPIKALTERLGARLLVDATGSIGLEDNHELGDVIAYSSCKGLFGLTGAAFVAYNVEPTVEESSFFLRLASHVERKMTGPYHAICSLDRVLEKHEDFRSAVRTGKDVFCRRYSNRLVLPPEEQPLLCTLLRGKVLPLDDNVVLYEPRSLEPGTAVVCHLGEGYLGRSAKGDIYSRIEVVD
jgi:cytidyltransferase-like protein